jgi:hypothetical protein
VVDWRGVKGRRIIIRVARKRYREKEKEGEKERRVNETDRNERKIDLLKGENT